MYIAVVDASGLMEMTNVPDAGQWEQIRTGYAAALATIDQQASSPYVNNPYHGCVS
jgi:hypothetical protein